MQILTQDFIPKNYYEIKGSKFLAYLYIIDSITFKQINISAKLRQEHKKAVHFVLAYRILNEFNQIIEGSSDDGEPHGSSGPPMLEVLRGENIINVACVCVRYFGGVKLGVGGLVRAYTQSLQDSLQECERQGLLAPYRQLKSETIESKSANYPKIEHLAKKYNLKIIKKEFAQDRVTLQILGTDEDMDRFLEFKL